MHINPKSEEEENDNIKYLIWLDYADELRGFTCIKKEINQNEINVF